VRRSFRPKEELARLKRENPQAVLDALDVITTSEIKSREAGVEGRGVGRFAVGGECESGGAEHRGLPEVQRAVDNEFWKRFRCAPRREYPSIHATCRCRIFNFALVNRFQNSLSKAR